MMTQDQRAKALECVKGNSRAGARTIIRSCGCTRYAADCFLKEFRSGSAHAAARPIPPSERRSLSEFQNRFDYRGRLTEALDRNCGDQFVSELELRSRSGVPSKQFSALARTPEFSRCRLRDGGVFWWSTAKNVAAVRSAARKVGVSK